MADRAGWDANVTHTKASYSANMPSSHHSDDSISVQSSESHHDDKQSFTGTSTDGQSANTDKTSKEEQIKLVQSETRQVLFLRVAVILILLCTAAVVSYLIFSITSKGNESSLDSKYSAAAAKVTGTCPHQRATGEKVMPAFVIPVRLGRRTHNPVPFVRNNTETFRNIATDNMGAVGSLVVAIVAEGLTLKRGWPFVTLSAFQERAATVMRLSGALYIGVIPLVRNEERAAWENYTLHDPDRDWYEQGRQYQRELGYDVLCTRLQIETDDSDLNLTTGIANHIYDLQRVAGAKAIISPPRPFYLPVWQTSPVTNRSSVNQNRANNSQAAITCMNESAVVFDALQYSNPGSSSDPNPVSSEMAWLLTMADRHKTGYQGDAFTYAFFPLFDGFEHNRAVVGVLRIVFLWARYFQDILTTGTNGIVVVLENGCNEPYTYQINGPNVTLLGPGDHHDRSYDGYEKIASFAEVLSIADGTSTGLKLSQDNCTYGIRVYPSDDFVADYETKTPMIVTTSVACVFAFTILMFFLYDCLVERRQKLIMRKAQQTHKIVASLFPKNVRDRLLENDHENQTGAAMTHLIKKRFTNKNRTAANDSNTPLADLFPSATVLFADISGFTAWSSSREPTQVFILLQTLYQEFDRIANRLKVFKVETIGDSYVAVAGLPDPNPKHALVMTRFAAECMLKATEVFRDLETNLGPGTCELMIRIGLNSGPVTAGVLRGERARFQLFGDTVNTASRMESTGVPGKIHASQATADQLKMAGKAHWVRPREDHVVAKGKGVMDTFWITPHAKPGTSNGSSETGSNSNSIYVAPQVEGPGELLRKERLIDWMVELLLESIKQVVAQRKAMKVTSMPVTIPNQTPGQRSLDEVVEIIELPAFNEQAVTASLDIQPVEPSGQIVSSLRELVATIASTYRDNPFHNFDHACHVAMGVSKFLNRIFTPEIEFDTEKLTQLQDGNEVMTEVASHLHDYMHSIASDPITVLAVVFSALIHDVDHRGVSNTQLMKEDANLAEYFRNKSIAEQNSLEIAWTILAEDRFIELRNYIFGTQQELNRFRQITVNVVLATDLFDKDLNDLRKARWEKAFSDKSVIGREMNGLRATIVLEHIIQASDVCHTMQHWDVYRKWNSLLFHELVVAYRAGRLGADPSGFWYQGELSFFDNYVIPLAKKLKDCKVFGISCDEVLNYALSNRAEWEVRGKEIVDEMIKEFGSKESDIGA